MEIVRATIADAEQILALQKLAYYSEAELNNDFAIPPLTQTLAELCADFAIKEIVKVVVDGQIIASGQVRLEGNTCHIGRMMVSPALWGKGIGSKVLRSLESVFPGATRCELFTGSLSQRNIYLYKKHGYNEFKTADLGKATLVFLEKYKN